MLAVSFSTSSLSSQSPSGCPFFPFTSIRILLILWKPTISPPQQSGLTRREWLLVSYTFNLTLALFFMVAILSAWFSPTRVWVLWEWVLCPCLFMFSVIPVILLASFHSVNVYKRMVVSVATISSNTPNFWPYLIVEFTIESIISLAEWFLVVVSYRGYCSRRQRRLRKTLNFKMGNRHKFTGKKVTEDLLTDNRYWLLSAKCWMHLANTFIEQLQRDRCCVRLLVISRDPVG